jgi:hypothetical protein
MTTFGVEAFAAAAPAVSGAAAESRGREGTMRSATLHGPPDGVSIGNYAATEKPSCVRSSAAALSSIRLIEPIGTITSAGVPSPGCGRMVTKP